MGMAGSAIQGEWSHFDHSFSKTSTPYTALFCMRDHVQTT